MRRVLKAIPLSGALVIVHLLLGTIRCYAADGSFLWGLVVRVWGIDYCLAFFLLILREKFR